MTRDTPDTPVSSVNHLLINHFDRPTLEARVRTEPFRRKTLSFYRYVHIEDPVALRDSLFREWEELGGLGRVYLAEEGINGQMSVPEPQYDAFVQKLQARFPALPIKLALEEEAPSFIKLVVKVRKKIVADGLNDKSFDVTNVGKHLTAREFNEAMSHPGTVVVDVRNHYESEIGHFEGALCPDVDTFREEIQVLPELLAEHRDQKILLYCTGGIRCEKTSAWLRHHGFKDVNQLHGGIIDYAKQVKEEGLENRFRGRNFVFDERMGEKVSGEVISSCHQCGKPADTHVNCAWQVCHLLFIQCAECHAEMLGCCSPECRDIIRLPEEEQERLRKSYPTDAMPTFRSRRRPDARVRCK